jgi:hypothetical protein
VAHAGWMDRHEGGNSGVDFGLRLLIKNIYHRIIEMEEYRIHIATVRNWYFSYHPVSQNKILAFGW